MTAAKKAVAMCCVTIGYRDYLMPADKGMKVVELMQSAFECEKGWGSLNHNYVPGEQPQVCFEMVRPSQIKAPPAPAPAGTRLLSAPTEPAIELPRRRP